MKGQLGTSILVLLLLAALVPGEAVADSRHGRHGHYRGHHGYYGHGHHGYHGIGLSFGYPYYRGYYGYPHGPFHAGYYGSRYYRPYYARYPYYSGYAATPSGGVDLNVKPKKTQVFINGQYIGNSGAFDGWPRYLWLPKDSYQLILYKPGYVTVERQLTINPGVVIDLKVQLVPGESTPPSELAPPQPPSTSQPAREIRSRPSNYVPADLGTDVADAETGAEVEVRDLPGESGRLQLTVTPGDASVYLDGRFLGRGEDLAGLGAGLVIEPGEHLLEVVRPGREPETVAFRAAAGETVELAVTLEIEKG